MKTFDTKLALIFARLSAIAYIDDDITATLKALGFDLVKRLGKTGDLSGFICKNANYSVLVFQGTDIKDWQTIKEDLKFWHKRDNGVSYTDGFLEAYYKLYPEFMEYLNTDVPLYITGHSLGGAIALITAMRDAAFEACYTFGAPRVCGVSGEHLGDGKAIFKLIHENDIVPSLPLIIMGYRGIGQMIYITSNDTLMTGWRAYLYRITAQLIPLTRKGVFDIAVAAENFFTGNQVGAIKQAATAVKESVFNLAGYVTNHLIENYIEALQTAADKAK